MTNSFICEHDFLLRYVSFLAAECFRAVQIPFFEVDFIRLHNDTKVSAHPLSMSNSLSHLFSSREKGQRSRVKLINTVEIRTVVEGFNSGRAYYIRCDSGDECRRITSDLNVFSQTALRRFELRTPFERFRVQLKSIYDSLLVQKTVGLLIIAVSSTTLASIFL